jgi:hypothetical protein
MLQTSRGRIRIVNRPALEGAVCECYRFVAQQIDKLTAIEHIEEPVGRSG